MTISKDEFMKFKPNYLMYTPDGYNPTVLIQMEMADPVNIQILQHAWDKAIERYPYFKIRIIRKDEDIHYIENTNQMEVIESDKLRALGSSESGYNLMEVHGKDHSIYLQFHHGIADGNGIMPFFRTLLYCYCCEYYKRNFIPGNINMPDSQVDPEEYIEPGENVNLAQPDEPEIKITENRFELPELPLVTNSTRYIFHISFPMKEFVRFMKQNDSSPAVIIGLFMSHAIDQVHPDHKGDIVTELAWNYRKEVGLEKCHNNCVNIIALTYNEKVKNLPLELQGTIFRGMTFSQTRESDAIRNLSRIAYLQSIFKKAGSYEGKKKIMSYIGSILEHTYCISYTGQMELGECEEKCRNMHINAPIQGSILIEVSSVNETISIDITQKENIPLYVDAFCHILTEEGIHYTRIPVQKFVLPEPVLFSE